MESQWLQVEGRWRRMGLLPQPYHAHRGGAATGLTTPALVAFVGAVALPSVEQLQQCTAASDGCQLGSARRAEQAQACLATCLQLHAFPYGQQVLRAMAALQASPLWLGLRGLAAAACSQQPRCAASTALTPLLAALMPEAPPATLRMLAACVLVAGLAASSL